MNYNSEPKLKSLKRFNFAAGVVHVVQGLLILILSNHYSLPIQTNFLKFDPATDSLTTVTQNLIEIPLGPLIALFLFITAIAHLSCATWGFQWYVRNLTNGINPARWYEYAITSSIMIVVIAMLSGIYDIAALLPIIGANASMNLFGLLMESKNPSNGEVDWSPFYFGSFAGALPWLVIIIYFFGAVADSAGSVPLFLYVLIAVLLLFWITFPINMILQYKKIGKWKDYLYGEKWYIILSLFSKSALAWIVFGGTLRGI